jgi:hypothetical protein
LDEFYEVPNTTFQRIQSVKCHPLTLFLKPTIGWGAL